MELQKWIKLSPQTTRLFVKSFFWAFGLILALPAAVVFITTWASYQIALAAGTSITESQVLEVLIKYADLLFVTAGFLAGLLATNKLVNEETVRKEEIQRELDNAKLSLQGKPYLEISYNPDLSIHPLGNDNYFFYVEVQAKEGSVRGIIVSIEKCNEIRGFQHLINRPLRYKHYPNSEGLTSHPGERLTVHVFKFRKEAGATLILLFQNGEFQIPAGNGPFKFTLRATGDGAKPDYKTFVIGIRGDGMPFMNQSSSTTA